MRTRASTFALRVLHIIDSKWYCRAIAQVSAHTESDWRTESSGSSPTWLVLRPTLLRRESYFGTPDLSSRSWLPQPGYTGTQERKQPMSAQPWAEDRCAMHFITLGSHPRASVCFCKFTLHLRARIQRLRRQLLAQ